MKINAHDEAVRYGNLSIVAIRFHVETGNPDELEAAVYYARAAMRFARTCGDKWIATKALILRSVDGQDWDRILLYPETWDTSDTDERVREVLAFVRGTDPDGWTWADIEPLLIALGFTAPICRYSPQYWDE